MDKQIRRLGVFLMLLFCALFAQLNYIQVFRAEDLNVRPGNSRPVDQAFSRPRGVVTTADGVVVARSVPVDDQFKYQREFPEGELYAHVTGYFNYQFGATGIESAYNTELTGRAPNQQIKEIGDLFVEKDRTGNVRLTIRSDVQKAARDALGAQKGSVVALDPRTGAVLALWSWPSFDPNVLSTHDLELATAAKAMLEAADGAPLLAKTYREIYPPGSTFKVVTASAGVETGMVTVDQPVYPTITALDLPLTNKDLPNFGGSACGGTLLRILARSCNTSFGQMGLDLGSAAMRTRAESFGFNDRPPFDLPAVASRYPQVDFEAERRDPELAQTAIGQNDVAATPLQMALVAAGIANGGVIMAPHVMDEIRDGEADVVDRWDPREWTRATSPSTAQTIMEAMREVVRAGSATRLQIEGLDVGAKTGTAQIGSEPPLRSHAWVIAWAGPPGQAPTVAVAVLVQAQEGVSEQTGGRVAAPIAKQVIEAAMQPMPEPPAVEGSTTTTTEP
jgi:peptidoglycan glycosyltransferase